MIFKLEIACDDDAFQPEPHIELSRILTNLAEHIGAFAPLSGSVRDLNGNGVGSYHFEEDD